MGDLAFKKNVHYSDDGVELVEAADYAAMRTALGLGTIATQAANSVNIDGGTVDGLSTFSMSATPTISQDADDQWQSAYLQWHHLKSADRAIWLREQARASKGGIIGTGGRGVVALRFDDYEDTFYSTIYPLLVARGLPASLCVISKGTLAEQPWWATVTWDNIRTMNRNGIEIWSHGQTHRSWEAETTTYAKLYDEIVTSKAELEAQSIKVQGWATPGFTGTQFNFELDTPSRYNTLAGMLIQETYGLSEAYAGSTQRFLPDGMQHGVPHKSVDSFTTLAGIQAVVDAAITAKTGVEFMTHSGNIGAVGYMSLAVYTQFLDYIVTKWNSGDLVILTPSQLCFADRHSTNRYSFGTMGSFENITTGQAGYTNWGTKTIETDGGHTGNNYLHIPIGDTSIFYELVDIPGADGQIAGETFVLEYWAREMLDEGGVYANPYVYIQHRNVSGTYNTIIAIGTEIQATTGQWTRIRHAFTIPPWTTDAAPVRAFQLLIGFKRSGSATLDIDDIRITNCPCDLSTPVAGEQQAATVFAGPATGVSAPTFRALVAGDIPALPQLKADLDANGNTIHFGTAENEATINTTPNPNTCTVNLGAENHWTIPANDANNPINATITLPPGPCGGTIFVENGATPRDITWLPAESVLWLGTEPDLADASEANQFHGISWRFNGTYVFLSDAGKTSITP